jgi:hypothetical protein
VSVLEPVKYRTALLEKLRFESRAELSVSGIEFDLTYDICKNEVPRLIVRLNKNIWTEQIQDETVTLEVETPATWWQHLKQDLFPKWAIKRWPVKMIKKEKKHTFKTHALFPEFNYEAPRECGQFIIRTMVE